MTTRDDDFNPRPGRIRHGNQGAKRPKSFVGEVMRAAKKAGHRGQTFRQSSGTAGRSTFGRGRRAALSLASRSPSRRVVVMARIVRHRGGRFRSAPLSKHVAYLKREGVTRDGADARMFDADFRRRRHEGFRRTVRGGPASFPVHGVARGCGPDGRPSRLHSGTDGRRGARPRHEARLGRGRSLEHRQSPHPCARPRPRRRRAGPGHQPRLHQQRLSRPRRGAGHAGIGAAQRAGDPRWTGEGGRGRTLDQPRSIAPRHLRRGRRGRRSSPGRRRRRPRTAPVDDRPRRQARTARLGGTGWSRRSGP